LLWGIQDRDFCWPAVVGIQNGTGERAHLRILKMTPPRKAKIAMYGTVTPKK
jgi:hypothetical protein